MNNIFLCKRIFAILWLFVFISFNAFSDDSADKLIKKIQNKYNSMQTVSIRFTQQVQFGVTKSEQTFKGKFLMKKGNKYLIELEHQKIVTDGNSVWSINDLNQQVIIDKYRDDPNSFSPDKVLVSIPQNYSASLLAKEKIDERDMSVVKLIPKDKKINYKWLKVWIGDDLIMKKVQLLDVSENLTTYFVDEIKINQEIPDSQFQYKPESNLEIIDLR